MNKKLNRITSAGTKADSDKMPKLTTSSHHIAKPHVVRSPFCVEPNTVAKKEISPHRKMMQHIFGKEYDDYMLSIYPEVEVKQNDLLSNIAIGISILAVLISMLSLLI